MYLHLPNRLGILVQHFEGELSPRATIKALHHLSINAKAQDGSGNLVVLSDHRLFGGQGPTSGTGLPNNTTSRGE